MQPISPSKELK